MIKVFSFLFLLLSSCFITSGQGGRLLFHSLGVDDGLSHSSVYALIQDKQGFIWAGTADGLNRYDGKSVKVYRPKQAIQNPDAAYIRDCISEDGTGNIWYANETGIYCWEARAEEIKLKTAFKGRAIAAYGLDEQGGFWLHDLYRGVFRYDIHTGDTLLFPYPTSFEKKPYGLIKVTTDHKAFFWFSVHDDGAYYKFNAKTKRYYKYQFGNDISLLRYDDGYLWLSDSKVIRSLEGETMAAILTIPWKGPRSKKMNLLVDQSRYLWLSTGGKGLFCIDTDGAILRHYSHNNYSAHTIPSDIITAIIQDKGKNLWIATDGAGLSRADLKPQAFEKFPVEERDYPQMKDFFTWSLYEDKKGLVWFSTHKSGLNTYDPVTSVVRHVDIPQLSDEVHIATISGSQEDGIIWLGYSNGVGYLKKGIFISVPLSIPEYFLRSGTPLQVYKLLSIEKDKVMLATSAGVKLLVNRGGWKEELLPMSFSLRRRTTDIVPAGENKYWSCSQGSGLYLFEYTGNSCRVLDSFLLGESVRSIHRDEVDSHILWLSSKVGVWKFSTSDHSAALLSGSDGLANTNVYGVLEDENNDLWMSTNGGLSCYKRKEKIFKNYSYSSGLQSNEFNSSAFHKGTSGKLYFGGVRGFNWFTAATVSFDTSKPQVAITRIAAEDSLIQLDAFAGHTIDLPYRKNSVSVSVAVLDFTRPEANQVAYKLDGWDKLWNTMPAGEIKYTNLPPGSYTLHIYGISSNKVQGSEYLLQINILAPFWQQAWFRVLCFIFSIGLIALIIYLWYRQRIKRALNELRQQKMLAEERSRISQDLHDEIGSAITQISLISDLLPLQEKSQDAMLEDVKVISATARKVAGSMSEIVWTLQGQHDTLENLLSYLREQSREFLDPIGIRYEIDFPLEVPAVQLSGERRRNILLVSKEALNNAVKYSQASCIRISCLYEHRRIIFRVEDNGVGFDPARITERGNGLKNMQKRMLAIGGEIAWDPTRKGTCVIYSIEV